VRDGVGLRSTPSLIKGVLINITNRERLMKIFRGEIPDRPAVKLWALEPGQELLHPSYKPVYEAGMELTDLVASASSPFNLYWGRREEEVRTVRREPREGADGEWVNVIREIRTPEGRLRSVFQESTVGNPGYQKEYLLKEPKDIEKLFSLPYEPYPFSPDAFKEKQEEVGDRGITIFHLDHAAYGLQRLIGSEKFAIWSRRHRDLLLDAIERFAKRIREQINQVFEAGLTPVFGWVGPELCIPPLMSPEDFEDFVVQFDKPLVDLIHERGGYVWVHCHGNMDRVIEGFVDMGVDLLNPVEPPPMGDITLEEAFSRVGDQMGLEGNIETHELMTAPEDRMKRLIRDALDTGSGRRFVLCPSSGYMEDPQPGERLINNLLLYVREGVRYARTL